MKTYNNDHIVITAAHTITIAGKPIIWGSKTIIDDILVWCDTKDFTLIFFKFVCEVLKKYRVSFCLDKCELLKLRVEYVGHDILCHGSCLAQSKFNMIDDWPLPTAGQSLFFIYRPCQFISSICTLYGNSIKTAT